MATMVPFDTYIQTELLNTSEEDFSAVLKKSNISEEYMDDSVDILKKWYDQQPHLPPVVHNDIALRKLLFACKMSVEKVKLKSDNLMMARGQIPEIFADRDPLGKRMQTAMASMQVVVHPRVTKENYRIIQLRTTQTDPDLYDPEVSMSYAFVLSDMASSVDSAEGLIFILDYGAYTFKHFMKNTPSHLKRISYLSQECYAGIIKGIHIINLPPYGELTVNFLKPLMKKKIGDRFHVHHSLEDLYKHVPRETFPKDMGGDELLTCKEICDMWNKRMSSPEWRQWLVESSTWKADESKRPNDPTSSISGAICGSGTFRKLDID